MKDREEAERLLISLGAGDVDHPGGDLLGHLRRVAERLDEWGAGPAVRAAGLCHAAYGTDGFDHPLLDLAERPRLAGVIGPEAEALVYLYGGCDRRATYPLLSGSGPVPFRDRFTGAVREPAEGEVRAFLEITAANELDVLAHNPELAALHGPALAALFGAVRDRLSVASWRACRAQLGDINS
ncbi:hypothetical protein Lfu02_42540 [Longispora fulva]|uniref:DUF6817 domain-containing protein n=1 Tax=Longispora fulva TaxID=619741 RepID=A0A8J7KWL6_9ACTN|nr:hypothetical protein [Longispora fulva]MBG6136712.1 hypothetical protein [Longispora fulva]GIG59882.1 hypothetical protein Lfu02_42540 [Longispora fulva]